MIYRPEGYSYLERKIKFLLPLKLKIITSLSILLLQHIHANTLLLRVVMWLTFRNVIRQTFSFSQLQRPTSFLEGGNIGGGRFPLSFPPCCFPRGLDWARDIFNAITLRGFLLIIYNYIKILIKNRFS